MAEENNVQETKEAATPETKEVPETKEQEASKEKEVAGDQQQNQPPAVEAQPPKPVVHKTNYEKDVIYLFQFSRTPVIPSLSPYCLKVETYLRLAELKYEVSWLFFCVTLFNLSICLCYVFGQPFYMWTALYLALSSFVWASCSPIHLSLIIYLFLLDQGQFSVILKINNSKKNSLTRIKTGENKF